MRGGRQWGRDRRWVTEGDDGGDGRGVNRVMKGVGADVSLVWSVVLGWLHWEIEGAQAGLCMWGSDFGIS